MAAAMAAKRRPKGSVAAEMAAKPPVQPSAPPPPWILQSAKVTTPPASDDDDGGASFGVAHVKTDGAGENEHGQVLDPCAVRFKNLNLWLDKPVFKLFLQQTLNINAVGHVMK